VAVGTVGDEAPAAVRMVLIRHGEAECNVNGIVGGMLGCTGLTGRGVAQAEALRDRLARTGELAPTVAVYASTLPRAIQTAEIVLPALVGATHDGPPPSLIRDPDLCELRPGEADGLTWAQFTDRFEPPDWDSRPDQRVAPGGESWEGFVDRAADALRRIAEDVASSRRATGGAGGVVAVFCHAGVIEASLLRLLPVDRAVPRLQLHTVHTSLTQWRVDDGTWALERYNDAAHWIALVAQQAQSQQAQSQQAQSQQAHSQQA
jgi:2,3-bisphosphoglycerate-dependent phosphoglycerate mutase